jgi:hypothetical protein
MGLSASKSSHGPGNLTRVGWLKKACTEQPNLGTHPFMGISLPYGVRTLELEDFKFPKQSTTKFSKNEKEIMRGFLDTYP